MYLPLYDLNPLIELNTYTSPSCTIAGEVVVAQHSVVWNNAVIRGDIN